METPPLKLPSPTAFAGLSAALVLASAAALTAESPAVDPGLAPYEPVAGLSGAITIAHVEATETLIPSWVKGFGGVYPGIAVHLLMDTIQPGESMQAMLDGRAQLAPFVREIKAPEEARAREKLGHPPLEVAIASGSYATQSNTQALAIFVNARNPLARLTLTQLDAIYSTTRRREYPVDLTTWGQLGLSGEWAALPIHIYSMLVMQKNGNPPGIAYFFAQRVMLGGSFKAGITQLPDRGGARNNKVLEDVAHAVAADPAGIGFGSFESPEPNIRTLALAENADSPFFEGTRENVLRRHYPLSRKIFMLGNRLPGQPLDPVTREFLRYILSRDGQRAVALDPAGFLPLPATVVAEERAKLD